MSAYQAVPGPSRPSPSTSHAHSRSPSPPAIPSSRLSSFVPRALFQDDKLPYHTHARTGSSGGKGMMGPRRRRLVVQGAIVFGLLVGMGLWSGMMEGVAERLGQGREGLREESLLLGHAPLPGEVVGSHGVWHPDEMTSPASDPDSESCVDSSCIPSPDDPSAAPLPYWGHTLSSSRLLAGLSPFPANPPSDPDTPPLSSLGRFADEIYSYGPLTLSEYRSSLEEFATVAFGGKVGRQLAKNLGGYLSVGPDEEARGEAWDREKNVWQTDRDTRHVESVEVGSWRDGAARREGWEWELVTDEKAGLWIDEILPHSRIQELWNMLPSGILRSDTLRYLLLALRGGIYSDTDTSLLKPPSAWGADVRLWRDGAGWLSDEQATRIAGGQAIQEVLGRASVIVGVEADVGDREDWYDWWPRPIQIVQWTIASAPAHPITLQALQRVLHATAHNIDWAHEHLSNIKSLKDLGRYDDARKLLETNVLAEPKMGGPSGIMGWTGPGVWTDAVLSYLRVKYGMQWTDLKDLREPLRIGDVIILPVTGFSPGVGNFGSEGPFHPQAMVQHNFEGSWKAKEGNQ